MRHIFLRFLFHYMVFVLPFYIFILLIFVLMLNFHIFINFNILFIRSSVLFPLKLLHNFVRRKTLLHFFFLDDIFCIESCRWSTSALRIIGLLFLLFITFIIIYTAFLMSILDLLYNFVSFLHCNILYVW